MSSLYRIDELRRLEASAGARLPAGTLMQRAGENAADWIHAWLASGQQTAAPVDGSRGAQRILILCGPGNNGGDGFSCASALHRLGHRCLCWAPQASTHADAQDARLRWQRDGGQIVAALPDPQEIGLVVDALFGIGLTRPLDGTYLAALRWVRSHALPLLALDLPSGLDADTGGWVGGVAGAAARHTITFLGDKPGLHTFDGIDAAGTVTVARLGVEDTQTVPGRLNAPALFPAVLRPRPANCNKGDFGTLAIVGGAPGMVGAALLAARAALRLGAGKVFVDSAGARAGAFVVDPLQPELMWVPDGPAPTPVADVLVAGCGLGSDAPAHARIEQALQHTGHLVLDADALNLLAADTGLQTRLRARAAATTVLTPHPGEAARLLGRDTRSVQQDRVRHALALAERFDAVVVLKGAGSVIAAPAAVAERYVVNPTGSPALASAGTGDVLAGMIGALLAQAGRDGATHAEAARTTGAAVLEAVCAAVWLHGQAAQDFGAQIGLTASDLAPLAARALHRLRTGNYSGTYTGT